MKKLIEQKNDLIAEMANIVDTAKAESRAVSEAEAKRFEDCKAEISNIDKTIKMGEEMENLENKVVEVAPQMTAKEKDEKEFVNIIKSLKNEFSSADGGVTIPTSIAKRIIERVEEICPIWTMAEHYNVKGNLTLPAEDAEGTTLVMTYAEEFAEANDGKIKLKSVNLGEYLGACLCKVSNSLINNSAFDIVTYVVNKVAQKVAKFLERELLLGTEGKIEGLSTITGVETATAGVIDADDLIDLQESIPDAFQVNACWIMGKETRKAIRKLKDGDKQYILNKDYTSKWGNVLLGKPVYTTDVDLGGAVYYGDFSGLAVKISENINVQVLREKYATQHATGVLAFVGVDAKVQNAQKIKKLSLKV